MLRAEAEDEFRQMCLELPQFSFDVISKFVMFVRAYGTDANGL